MKLRYRSVTIALAFLGFSSTLFSQGATGRVIDKDTGSPIQGVYVDFFDSGGYWVAYGDTDASGYYTCTLPNGTYYATTENFSGYVDELYDNMLCPGGTCDVTTGTAITVAGGATTTGVDFDLGLGGEISGTITDTAAVPLQNIYVEIYDSGGSYVTYFTTDSLGEYLGELPSGTYFAWTWNDLGYNDELFDDIPCVGSCTVTAGTPIAILGGGTTSGVDFELSLGGEIYGTVTDTSGTPLQYVYVDIYDSGGTYVTSGYTDSFGDYFSWSGLLPGTYYTLTDNGQGYIDELFDDMPCLGGSCSVTTGTPITVVLGVPTTDIDFALDVETDTTGVFRPSNGLIYLKSTNGTGFADAELVFGIPNDLPVTGDWDGDGVDTIGVYRDGAFYLRNSNTTGTADIVVPFGSPGDLPVVGDWDGDGVDTIGIYRDGQFLLRNSNAPGDPDVVFSLGNPGDQPIAGDWNGSGTDGAGVFRPSNGLIFLKNQLTTGIADIEIVFGIPNDKPAAGDWDGDGIDTIGVYRDGLFLLRNTNTTGFADVQFALGVSGDLPICGKWGGLP